MKTVLDALRQAGTPIEAPCNGHGTCGKCRVKVSPAEQSPTWVLACQTPLTPDLVVLEVPSLDSSVSIVEGGRDLVTEVNPWINKDDSPFDNFTRVFAGDELLGVEPGDSRERLTGLVVDIGTTC